MDKLAATLIKKFGLIPEAAGALAARLMAPSIQASRMAQLSPPPLTPATMSKDQPSEGLAPLKQFQSEPRPDPWINPSRENYPRVSQHPAREPLQLEDAKASGNPNLYSEFADQFTNEAKEQLLRELIGMKSLMPPIPSFATSQQPQALPWSSNDIYMHTTRSTR